MLAYFHKKKKKIQSILTLISLKPSTSFIIFVDKTYYHFEQLIYLNKIEAHERASRSVDRCIHQIPLNLSTHAKTSQRIRLQEILPRHNHLLVDRS
jgi:hypothetical protein